MLTQKEIEALGPLPTPIPENVAELICRLIEADLHSWSSSPCQTCNSISALLGRAFGCQARAKGTTMKIYIAGPMRGLPNNNFEAFDEAEKRWQEAGWTVFSPAQLWRAIKYPTETVQDLENRERTSLAIQFDLACIHTCHAIGLLPGWKESRGTAVELALAQVLGLEIFNAVTMAGMFPRKTPWSFGRKANGK